MTRPIIRRARTVGAGLGVVLGAIVWWLMHDALGDDALISVAYAQTLAESGTWGVFPGIPANTQTSPLNVWLLAAGVWLVGHPVVVLGALLCATLAVLGWLAVDLANRLEAPAPSGWLAVSLVGTSPVLASTVGLEAYLGGTALVAVLVAAVAGRPVLAGVAVAGAVLVRPDLVVPAAVLALALVVVARRRVPALALTGGVAVLVAAPWHLWSWVVLGGLVPDTTWVRTGDRSGATVLGAMPRWLGAFPISGTASLIPVAAGLLAAAVALAHRDAHWARATLLLVTAGWSHLVGLQAIHAQGAGWYYAPVIVCSSLAAALTVAALAGRLRATLSAGAVLLVAGLTVASLCPVLPLPAAPLVANMALTGQYAAIGRELGGLTSGQPVEGPGELGALAFHSSVPVLDFLSEPAQTDRVMADRAAEGGPRAALMAWSSAHRTPTPAIATRWRLAFVDPARAPGRVVRVWPVVSPQGGHGQVVLLDVG